MNFRQKKKVLWAFDRVYLKYINCKSGFNFLGPNDYFVYPSCIICERVFHIQMLNTVVQHENKNQLTYLFITFDTVCCFFFHTKPQRFVNHTINRNTQLLVVWKVYFCPCRKTQRRVINKAFKSLISHFQKAVEADLCHFPTNIRPFCLKWLWTLEILRNLEKVRYSSLKSGFESNLGKLNKLAKAHRKYI